MNIGIAINQFSTHRGAILVTGAAVSLVFEWFGHSSTAVMPIFVGMAGLHGVMVNDK